MSFWGFLRWIFEGKEQSYQIKDATNFSHNITTNNNPVITWDNGSHTIQNPSNYSYSVQSIPSDGSKFYLISSTGGDVHLDIVGDGTNFYRVFTDSNVYTLDNGSLKNLTWNHYINIGGFKNRFYVPTSTPGVGLITEAYFNKNINPTTGRIFPTNWSPSEFTLITFSVQMISGGSTNQLIVIDDGIEYSYPIDDVNSITESNEPIYTLNINDGGENLSFPIDDPNSVYPEERTDCPKDTITCDCNGLRCCYKKYNSYYKLIKTIKL